MVRAKRIYVLIIKDNKLSSLFSLRCFLKKIENMYPVFLSSYRNTCESLGELEKAVGTLSCCLCSNSISRSPKLPLLFLLLLLWAQDFYHALICWVGYNHLIDVSNKREWTNCFVKNIPIYRKVKCPRKKYLLTVFLHSVKVKSAYESIVDHLARAYPNFYSMKWQGVFLPPPPPPPRWDASPSQGYPQR